MAEITAALVKELRETTGAGMMDCKKALTENDGELEAAIDWLRAKGLSKAAKKADRVAAEGLVGVAVRETATGALGAVVEVNAETDFVGRNEKFQSYVKDVAELALETNGDVTVLENSPMAGGASAKDTLTDLIATIGENMNIRRTNTLSAEPGVVASYVHGVVAEGMGRIGVLVALKSEGDKEKLADIGRKIAMHVAAASPIAKDVDDVDADTVQRERAILSEKARESGKPDNIIEKMVEGGLQKFFKESVLLKQVFVIDGERTVENVLQDAKGEVGAPVELVGFVRMALGEGVEKKQEDFAAEVAAAAGKS